ncbi:hypothetical protein [Streptomyces sp. NBC_00624]|uniref:hypothetical protein n=1 Tax=Streptomyces sp. NBC_00624 TaxID=2975791 RepID=UPI0030DFB01C
MKIEVGAAARQHPDPRLVLPCGFWAVGAVLAVIGVKIAALTVFGRHVHRSRRQAG